MTSPFSFLSMTMMAATLAFVSRQSTDSSAGNSRDGAPQQSRIASDEFSSSQASSQRGAGIGELSTTLIASGLIRPLYLTAPPGDADRLFIVEQRGSGGIANRADIRIYKYSTGALNATPFLSITGVTTGSEQGLLGLAFHPNYASNGLFFVNYTTAGGGAAGKTVVARYQVSSNPDIADPSTATTIIEINQPQSNHNGGWSAFGPDGYLYIATGDGGAANDFGTGHIEPTGNGQSLDTLLGKMLRIDVDSASPYANPPDNPFVGAPGMDEIWAYGLRNPWRPGFDSLTGDLWIADVGQGAREEVNFQPAGVAGGRNYGWRCMEGDLCTGFAGCVCFDPVLISPLHVYDHLGGRCSITGGRVYRGSLIPALQGNYFFADFCSSQIWSLRYDGTTVSNFQERTAELAPGGGLAINSITSFGQDARGELYIIDGNSINGEIYKIVRACAADITGDGAVNVSDLLAVINAWGPCPAPCPPNCGADAVADCVVNVSDLLAVINAWGPCPQ